MIFVEAEVEEDGCKYIEGDTKAIWTYCNGQRKFGSSYCEHHHGICYLNEEDSKREIARMKILARSEVGFEKAHMIIGDRS